jgi:hypothetical protein
MRTERISCGGGGGGGGDGGKGWVSARSRDVRARRGWTHAASLEGGADALLRDGPRQVAEEDGVRRLADGLLLAEGLALARGLGAVVLDADGAAAHLGSVVGHGGRRRLDRAELDLGHAARAARVLEDHEEDVLDGAALLEELLDVRLGHGEGQALDEDRVARRGIAAGRRGRRGRRRRGGGRRRLGRARLLARSGGGGLGGRLVLVVVVVVLVVVIVVLVLLRLAAALGRRRRRLGGRRRRLGGRRRRRGCGLARRRRIILRGRRRRARRG